jgi:poly-beta-hydroxybutyrate-responsive repressor
LLLLRERPAHGYELLEQLPELTGERVDMGNLYRFLRLLEAEGLVSSEWDDEAPGPSKRVYELTGEGRTLLDEWASALRDAQARADDFLTRYEERR